MTSNEELFAKGMEYYDDSDYWNALPILKELADSGHLLAAEKVANCYNRTGDPESAVPYWEICRTAGNHSANTNYASYLKDVANQPDLAMQLWREASDAGIYQATFNLGVWLKNLGQIEEAKTLLKKAGDQGYLDGYFVLAGIYYHAGQWDQAREAVVPFASLNDERVERLLLAISMKEEEESEVSSEEEDSESAEFDWNDYAWDWKTPDDVREFVDLVLENHDIYEYAYDTLSGIGSENFYCQWWAPVQDAIKSMAKNFSKSDLEESIEHLLAPEGGYVECDPAIFDALLKYVPGFPADYPQFSEAINNFIEAGAEYTSDWWDFTWYPFIGAEFTWTFWGPETMARSRNVSPELLTTIFKLSFIAETPYKSFRSRVALATNPNSPKEILEFLFRNKDNNDWLINDYEEEGALLFQDGRYVINEELESIDDLRKNAELVENFRFPSDNRWSSGPGAEYVENLIDIQWEADCARSCLLAALAKNPALEVEQYEELGREEHPLVRYLLSINPSIPGKLKELLAAEKPTFTYKPYGSHPKWTDDVTLGE
jgi:Tfp pilus assembly protein PilF